MYIFKAKELICGGEAVIGSEKIIGGGVWTQYLETEKIPGSCVEFVMQSGEEFSKAIAPFGVSAGKDAFVVKTQNKQSAVYGRTVAALIYGAVYLSRVSLEKSQCGSYLCSPAYDFRGFKCFLPSRERVPEFKQAIDLCLKLGVNKVMIEVGGAMEYKRRPEINAGWLEYCKKFVEYPGQSVDYQFGFNFPKDSIHWENGCGEVLSQDLVRELVDYCNERGMEVIPEVPTMTHSDYLLLNHKEFAERKEDPTPDTYCPSCEGIYDIVFDVIDEVAEVFKPSIINIGHDEAYSVCLCDKCKDKDPAKLYADDINKINRYIRKKGITTMMWSDKLLNAIGKAGNTWGGSENIVYNLDKTYQCTIPAMYKCIDLIDRDVMQMHWYWSIRRFLEKELEEKFVTVFGNYRGAEMPEYQRLKNTKGWCVSNWSETSSSILQRNSLPFHIAYDAMMSWGCPEEPCEDNVMKVAKDAYLILKGKTLRRRHIEITHAYPDFIKHEEFVDGFFIDKESDHIGEYVITTDRETITVPIDYGENIGYEGIKYSCGDSKLYDAYEYAPQLFETAGNCDYAPDGDKMFVRYAVPCDGEKIIDVKFVPYNNHKSPCVKSVVIRDGGKQN